MNIFRHLNWFLLLILLVNTLIAMPQTTTVPNNELNAQQRSIVAVASLTATGNLGHLKVQLDTALNAGLTINELKEVMVQLYAYCGFPRSLNAINTFRSVLEDRKSKGINDNPGKETTINTCDAGKYEKGIHVLEILTQTPQARPAPGYGEFAPRIDSFLKEHLFADIFDSEILTYQQRELVTISALASMPGVEPQLQSHLTLGMNTGLTTLQLEQLADLIERDINRQQANTLRTLISKPIVPVIENDIMVRIAAIEIVPEYLEEYKTILKEESSASIQKEPGVIAIFPISEQAAPTQIRIVEIYATKAAYQSHLQTPHFLHYKTATQKMVKSLKLIEMAPLDKDTMPEIFKKLH